MGIFFLFWYCFQVMITYKNLWNSGDIDWMTGKVLHSSCITCRVPCRDLENCNLHICRIHFLFIIKKTRFSRLHIVLNRSWQFYIISKVKNKKQLYKKIKWQKEILTNLGDRHIIFTWTLKSQADACSVCSCSVSYVGKELLLVQIAATSHTASWSLLLISL